MEQPKIAVRDEVVTVRVPPDGLDDEDLAQLTALLSEELLELDVAAVQPLTPEQTPDGAKGALGMVAGWLAVHLGPTAVRTVVETISAWSLRNSKTVEISLGNDVLKLSGVSREQQDRIIHEWFVRQTAST